MSENPAAPALKTKAQAVAANAAATYNQVKPEAEKDPNLVVNQADLVKPKTEYIYGNGTKVTNF